MLRTKYLLSFFLPFLGGAGACSKFRLRLHSKKIGVPVGSGPETLHCAGGMIRRSVAGVRVETVRTMTRAAFEIHLDDELVYSKLRQKRFPNFEAVVATIRQHVETGGPVQVGKLCFLKIIKLFYLIILKFVP